MQLPDEIGIKQQVFMQTLFQVNGKTNFNIDSLPALSALIYQAAQLNQNKMLHRPQFLQIGIKFLSLQQSDAQMLFDLFEAMTGEEFANPRVFIAFIIAVLFKSTVSSKRQKILVDIWPSQKQTFESMLEQYCKTCSDLFAGALCATNNLNQLQKMQTDSSLHQALSFLFYIEKPLQLKSAIDLSSWLQNVVCKQTDEEVERIYQNELQLKNMKQRAFVYQVQNPLNVELYNLQNAVVYIRGAVQSIQITACRGLKLYVPACACFSISNSKSVNVSGCCSFLKVFHSDDLKLNISTSKSCVQDCQLQTLQCGPCNLVVEGYKEELTSRKLDFLINHFEQYQVVGPLGLTQTEKVPNATDFCTFVYPFQQRDKACSFIFQLKEPFKSQLQKRAEKLEKFQQKMESLEGDKKLQMENEVKAQLESWLMQKNMQGEAGMTCQAEVKVV
uniref:C-CAP/cofactor C-like domain-containing protein n=1 Tax=Trepomonas sp. PC1 TaxID=1076344 RepID=A0A146KEC1_9EUKA|eukprot:JAP93791.1 hypothetical protein TPC1_13779 [Trepomonas sp. PC1]